MMRVFAGLLICVGGCTFVHGDLPEGDGEAPGSGSSDPGGDFDGDGLADLIDNCASVGNADQRDHDDDGRGDSCDACPHLPDTGSDADVDGVGDACDPNPTKPGERIAFFEGFYGNPVWKPVIGDANSWQLINGTLRQQQLDDQYQLVRDDNPDLVNVFVDVRVRVNSISQDPSMRRSTGVVLGYGDPKHYFFCGVAQGLGPEVNAGEVSTNFWGSAQYDYAAGPFASSMSGEWMTLQSTVTQTQDGTHIDCMGHRAGVTAAASYDAGQDTPGDIGIRTNGADASFDYVFVVALPPT